MAKFINTSVHHLSWALKTFSAHLLHSGNMLFVQDTEMIRILSSLSRCSVYCRWQSGGSDYRGKYHDKRNSRNYENTREGQGYLTQIGMWGYSKVKGNFLQELRLKLKYSHSEFHTFFIPLMINITVLWHFDFSSPWIGCSTLQDSSPSLPSSNFRSL